MRKSHQERVNAWAAYFAGISDSCLLSAQIRYGQPTEKTLSPDLNAAWEAVNGECFDRNLIHYD